ncbi:hypothetical protein EVAR_96636_1 [Eumeta japonica]|uniref:Uncharacterized protein n=1 Tax=Eumeta variegata TaxID=151549 RepID=A0A4C1WRE1_EUMVA|nr:hypothetical protein EVAR_96636_1 [Eumeta japonica]
MTKVIETFWKYVSDDFNRLQPPRPSHVFLNTRPNLSVRAEVDRPARPARPASMPHLTTTERRLVIPPARGSKVHSARTRFQLATLGRGLGAGGSDSFDGESDSVPSP